MSCSSTCLIQEDAIRVTLWFSHCSFPLPWEQDAQVKGISFNQDPGVRKSCETGPMSEKQICFVSHWDFEVAYHSNIGEGNGNPLQYSCPENPMDGVAWRAAVPGVTRSWTRLSDFTFTFHFHTLGKEIATHSSVLAWESQGWQSLVGCRLWGGTESDTTEVTWQHHSNKA